MICAFCDLQILDDKFFKSRDIDNCFIHNSCLLPKLPAFAKFTTEDKIDNLIELIIQANIDRKTKK